MTDDAKALHPDEIWERMEHNQKLRKLLDDTRQVDLIKESDMRSKAKYDQIDRCVSLLEKMRMAIQEIRRTMSETG